MLPPFIIVLECSSALPMMNRFLQMATSPLSPQQNKAALGYIFSQEEGLEGSLLDASASLNSWPGIFLALMFLVFFPSSLPGAKLLRRPLNLRPPAAFPCDLPVCGLSTA